MGKINATQRSYLEGRFGNRASFRKAERRLYGHDIAAVPSLIKPLIGDTTPEAVVQPETEEELVELVRWAREHHVPLTPRGKASSGYGGVLPVKKGLVVDFYRMNRVIRADPDAQTATVQAGVVWEKLDRELKKQGLTLKTVYVFFSVSHWRRRLVHLNVTAHATVECVWRQLIEASPWGEQPKHLIRDRDCRHGGSFNGRAARLGTYAMLNPVQAP